MRKLNRKRLPEFMRNKNGEEVATKIIREDHLKKHLVVEGIFKEAEKIEKRMLAVKKKIVEKVIAYEKWLMEYNKVKDAEFGGITLTNYNSTMQLQIKGGSITEFDETLQLAKAKIDGCVKRWAVGSNSYIIAIINRVFKVDKKGFINKSDILSLFQYEIDDAEWVEAMELIRKSIIEVAKKDYLMLRTRKSKDHDWENVNLNFSSISIEE